MREMARGEIKEIEARMDELQAEIQILLLPKDPNDDRNVMIEIRAGTGGSEANIFAGECSCVLRLLGFVGLFVHSYFISNISKRSNLHYPLHHTHRRSSRRLPQIHVQPRLESLHHGRIQRRRRRIQIHNPRRKRRHGILQNEMGSRRPSRPTCTRHRIPRKGPYLHGNRCSHARMR